MRTLTNFEASLLTDSGYTPTNCLTCRGKKTFRWWATDTRPSEIVEYECRCVDQWIMYRYFEHCGIPLGYQRLGWGDATHMDSAAASIIFDYVGEADARVAAGWGLFFHGASGTGKTMATALLTKYLVSVGFTGYFTTFNGLLSMLDSRDSALTKEQRQGVHDKILNAQVLVLDDPGREHRASIEFAVSAFDQVLRQRVASRRPTFVTTNYSMNEFEQRYTTPILRLLTERSDQHPFTGSDFRPSANKREREEISLGLSRPVVVG